jgi:CubicO group peptidase (beta-lactamase class C family)
VRRTLALLISCTAIGLCIAPAWSKESSVAETIAAYIQPYAASNNFAGSILVARGRHVIFAKSYGFADREQNIANGLNTRFHIALMSMQFTAAATMRLVERGDLSLDARVDEFVKDFPNGDKITIRDLLAETSGLPDINEQPSYDDILQHHQTASALVQAIRTLPPASEPGGVSKREEHSAYNLLALIIETKTHIPFADAVKRLVLAPLHMRRSGIDDDRQIAGAVALGYEPEGVSGLKRAIRIKWSAKTGNASAYSTVKDELLWLDAFFGDRLVGSETRQTMLNNSTAIVGYGWFKNVSKRFGEPIFYMNGRAPGFASAISYLPREKLSVVVLSNVYASVTTSIDLDIAALLTGKSFDGLKILGSAPDLAEFRAEQLQFKFGSDFYQPNAVVKARVADSALFLDWPSGLTSPLIPIGVDQFIDRGYWENVKFIRGLDGKISSIQYDRFSGTLLP